MHQTFDAATEIHITALYAGSVELAPQIISGTQQTFYFEWHKNIEKLAAMVVAELVAFR